MSREVRALLARKGKAGKLAIWAWTQLETAERRTRVAEGRYTRAGRKGWGTATHVEIRNQLESLRVAAAAAQAEQDTWLRVWTHAMETALPG